MSYTVKDLIEELKKLPENLAVVVSSDEEGNDFNGWSGDISFARTNQWGEVSTWTYDLDEDGDEDESTERRVTSDEADSIIIWP